MAGAADRRPRRLDNPVAIGQAWQMQVYLNGAYVEEQEAKISVFDHGVLYGDGVFEGIRLYGGCVFRLKEHLERLQLSAKAILMELPLSLEALEEAVCVTCLRNNLTDGYIRLIVTRGVGNLGLSHLNCTEPQLIIIADTITLYPKEFYTKGLKIITAATRRINPAALPPMIKSLNYLNNILAKAEAHQAGCLEALMLNDEGYVAECTGDNVFLRQGKVWKTPKVQTGALRGITRGAVLDLMNQKGMTVVEDQVTRFETWTADEMFLTGTAAELIPVVEVDGRVIGDGSPGQDTGVLLEAFHALVRRDGSFL